MTHAVVDETEISWDAQGKGGGLTRGPARGHVSRRQVFALLVVGILGPVARQPVADGR
jgi:hypothetical protein